MISVLASVGVLLLSLNLTNLLLNLAIPVVVALVTKSSASARLKAVLSMVFSAIYVLIRSNQRTDGLVALDYDTLYNFTMATLISVAAYLGIWQHLGINGKMLPTRGLG